MPPSQFADPQSVMRQAIELAAWGLGSVEPNPAVGAVIVDAQLRLLGQGCHERFGGPHAEIQALDDVRQRCGTSGPLDQATLFVTLEPCCHHGKTPPCTQAIIEAGIRRVVVGQQDPAPHANGRGIAELTAAGVAVELAPLESGIRRLNAPFVKRITTGMAYVHAKWAMTLDGKIATRAGASQWISNASSRQMAHRLRGRMDAIIVGIGTALADDPLLTARPRGPRTALRVVMDSAAKLPLDSQLVRTLSQAGVLVACTPAATEDNVGRLRQAGVEVLRLEPTAALPADRIHTDPRSLLQELGRREMTNVLVEGGGAILGSFFQRDLIDEIHVFVAPKLIGGAAAPTPIAGIGLDSVPELPQIDGLTATLVDGDVYLHGYVSRTD